MTRRARLVAAVGITLWASGCIPGLSPGLSHGASGSCSGEEVLDVFNPLTVGVDIYAVGAAPSGPSTWNGGDAPGTDAPRGTFIATAPSGRSTIPLSATHAEGRYVGYEARVGSNVASGVTLTRRCQ